MSFFEAIKDERWQEAIKNEIWALKDNGTWVMKHLPSGKKALRSKWVYKIKYNFKRIVKRFKA